MVGVIADLTVRSLGYNDRKTSAWAVIDAILIFGIALIIGHLEGILCLIMAAPLIVPMALLGAGLSRWILAKNNPEIQVSLAILGLIGASFDVLNVPAAAQGSESTSLVINAPARLVWPYVLNLKGVIFTDPMLEFGFAHPRSTRTTGQTVGTHRQCILTTGTMNEVVTVLQPLRRLRFNVMNTPPSMIERNPFGPVTAPHLVGHYSCEEGEFVLTPLPHHQTLLTGTSWYSFRIYPAPYWALWTDAVVERVHQTVMKTIKHNAELDRLNKS